MVDGVRAFHEKHQDLVVDRCILGAVRLPFAGFRCASILGMPVLWIQEDRTAIPAQEVRSSSVVSRLSIPLNPSATFAILIVQPLW